MISVMILSLKLKKMRHNFIFYVLFQFLLEEKGYSQVDLAKYLQVKQPNISEILKGTRDLSKDLMKKIHDKFKIPYECMF